MDSVDLMIINGEGKIVKSKDVQRALEEADEKEMAEAGRCVERRNRWNGSMGSQF
jgi:hypothetical protein